MLSIRTVPSMNFKEQPIKLPVPNFDSVVERDKKVKRHGDLLPDSIRAVFCGPSNCGKTNSLLALITNPNGVRFENVYVYSKSLNQPKYKFLKQLLEPLKGIKYFPFSEHEEVIAPDSALPNSIMIFDDIACEKQNNVRAFFCMGRHKKVDCFYLCQSYAQVPKHLVRDNVNLLIVFRQDDVNLKHLYDDHVNSDMTYARFKDLCAQCWSDVNHGFLMIDKDSPINAGRYRKGFDQFAINITRT